MLVHRTGRHLSFTPDVFCLNRRPQVLFSRRMEPTCWSILHVLVSVSCGSHVIIFTVIKSRDCPFVVIHDWKLRPSERVDYFCESGRAQCVSDRKSSHFSGRTEIQKTTLTRASVSCLHVFLLKPECSFVQPGVLGIVVTGPDAVCPCDA